MKLTRISPEKIEKVLGELAEKQAVGERAYQQSGKNPLAKPHRYTYGERNEAIADAQLETCEKEAQGKVKEIFEFIDDFDSMYWEDFNRKYCVTLIVGHSVSGLSQALKQKYLGED